MSKQFIHASNSLARPATKPSHRRSWVCRYAASLTLLSVLAGCEQIKQASSPPGFHDQFITLPSGHQAYCNRQGYREVNRVFMGLGSRRELVTTPKGEFVECDARVGPPDDALRTDANGNLMTPEQIAEAVRQKYEEERAGMAAEHARKQAQWREEREQFYRDEQKQVEDAKVRATEVDHINQQEAECRKPFDAAQQRYTSNVNGETGRTVSEAEARMEECLRQIQR